MNQTIPMKAKIRFVKVISLWLLLAAAIGGISLFFSGCNQEQASANSNKPRTLYTCGMHPQVIQDHPGNCPICGMKLTPIHKTADEETNAPVNPSVIAVD